ncbi:hypothetical protein NQZ68_040637 [Dissostichus eleginoides]|nr:hypothetical protein NQZ68_040637 [Dissostichus eleginoides]
MGHAKAVHNASHIHPAFSRNNDHSKTSLWLIHSKAHLPSSSAEVSPPCSVHQGGVYRGQRRPAGSESEAATIIALFHSNISFSSPGFVLRESNAANQRDDNIFHQLGDPGQEPSSFGKNQGRLFILSLRTCGPAFKLVTAAPLSSASPNMRALFRHGMELRVRAVQHHGCQTDPCQARRRGRRDQIARESSIRSFRTRGSLRCALTAISGTKAFSSGGHTVHICGLRWGGGRRGGRARGHMLERCRYHGKMCPGSTWQHRAAFNSFPPSCARPRAL